MMSRKRETRIWAQAGWLGCAAVAVLLMACGKKEEKGQSAPPTVMTFPLMGQDVTDTGEWFGYLRGIRDTDLHPRVTGFLLSQDYVNGSYVNEGDVLFRIDPATFQAELDLAKANLEAAQAGVVSARATVEQAQLRAAGEQWRCFREGAQRCKPPPARRESLVGRRSGYR